MHGTKCFKLLSKNLGEKNKPAEKLSIALLQTIVYDYVTKPEKREYLERTLQSKVTVTACDILDVTPDYILDFITMYLFANNLYKDVYKSRQYDNNNEI